MATDSMGRVWPLAEGACSDVRHQVAGLKSRPLYRFLMISGPVQRPEDITAPETSAAIVDRISECLMALDQPDDDFEAADARPKQRPA
jgi:hypothetical protein